HRHLLVLEDVALGHQPRVDGDRTDVVEVGVGDGGPVDLGLHHAASHQTVTPRLSMSRARPSRAAMSRRSSPLSTAGTVRSLASTTAAYSRPNCASAARASHIVFSTMSGSVVPCSMAARPACNA